MTGIDESILIVANWRLRKPLDDSTRELLTNYAAEVEATEPGTLVYRVHVGLLDNPGLVSLPPVSDSVITFIELYENEAAFGAHTAPGSAFSMMVEQYGDELFVIPKPFGSNDQRQNPFNAAQFYELVAGYTRPS